MSEPNEYKTVVIPIEDVTIEHEVVGMYWASGYAEILVKEDSDGV